MACGCHAQQSNGSKSTSSVSKCAAPRPSSPLVGSACLRADGCNRRYATSPRIFVFIYIFIFIFTFIFIFIFIFIYVLACCFLSDPCVR